MKKYRRFELRHGPGSGPAGTAGHEQAPDQRRRGLVAGVAAAGVSFSVPAAAEIAPTAASDNRSVRYSETEHIRRAYERMRF